MPAGRPPKPVELKRMLGNPGKRPLPVPVATLPVVQPASMPRGLGRHGRLAWRRLWQVASRWLSPLTDIEIITRLCQAYDEREMLRETIEEEGYFATGSMGQLVEHPAVRAVRRLEKHITNYESLCGLTPSDRARLGMVEIKAASQLEDFLARRRQAG